MEFASKTDQFNQFEGKNESNCVNFVSVKAASWPILLGSLDDVVNCESSLSPGDTDGGSVSPKSALVLRRPSHDCGPCEIKISFEQKHEIRQVYVRSTARVYEIYYAADRQSMNEYLCTVRCGLAAKTDECLQNMGAAATSVSPSSTGSNKLSEELKTYGSGNTNEDDWVEIKDPDSSLTIDGDSSSLNKTAVPVERENQDFYEATAEISDANLCTSMTIRLLSLQSGESAYIDEIYVFADPVECDDVNSTSKEVEHSAGNPLMSMLVPTLLQLSRSRMSHISEQPDPNPNSKKTEHGVSRNMTSASTSAQIQKEEVPSVSVELETGTSKLECPDQSRSLEAPTENINEHDKSGTTNGMNESSYHIGKTLDQLVSRIARIEQFCLSFEQKMINPITSMDARLGEVEQQLKLLNEKFQLPEMHSSTGTHAPGIPHNDSEFSSSHTDENTIPNCKVECLEKDDGLSYEVPAPSSGKPSTDDASLVPVVFTAPEFSISSLSLENDACCTEEVANMVSSIPSIAIARAHLVPSLVVTAPEFSYGEEEDNDDSISVGGSPCDKLKKPLSIDAALADALAGFVSSTIMQDSTITLNSGFVSSTVEQDITVTLDPDTFKTDDDSGKAGAKIIQHIERDELDATIETSIDVVAEIGEHDAFLFGSTSEPTVGLIAGHDHTLEEENAQNLIVHDVENECAQAEETGGNEIIGSKTLTDVPYKANSSSGEMVMKEDSLHGIVDLPIQSVVDYKIPILDVKFESRESSNLSSSIEALLTETAETNIGSSFSQGINKGIIAVQDYSVETDNNEVILLEASNQLLVDLGQDDSVYTSQNNSNEEVSVPLF
ncbi:hypothetical protein V2J09_012142 [Rumex salicifolius]